MKIKLLSDSSCDIGFINGADFSVAPLTVSVGKKQYRDDENLNIKEMLNHLSFYNGKTSTACPSVGEWLSKFDDADIVYVVAMTSALSGTYNSALAAKKLYLEANPGARVHVFDTLTTGPEQRLLVEKIAELIKQFNSFEKTVYAANAYLQKTRLFFSLESLQNFARNGRVSKPLADAVSLFGIRIISTASPKGTIMPLSMRRGEEKACSALLSYINKAGYCGGKMRICHIENYSFADNIRNTLKRKFPKADIAVYPARGLCSYYAERGGILIGMETF